MQGRDPEWVLAVQAQGPLLGEGPEWGREAVCGIRGGSSLGRLLVQGAGVRRGSS